MDKRRWITIEVEIDAGPTMVDTGYAAYQLQQHVEKFVYIDRQSKPWALSDHIRTIKVTAVNQDQEGRPS